MEHWVSCNRGTKASKLLLKGHSKQELCLFFWLFDWVFCWPLMVFSLIVALLIFALIAAMQHVFCRVVVFCICCIIKCLVRSYFRFATYRSWWENRKYFSSRPAGRSVISSHTSIPFTKVVIRRSFSFQRKGEQFQHETKLKGANFFSQNIFFKTHDPGVLHYGITENTEVL